MDILVLIMLALFLMVIALIVVIFVYIRKSSCQRVFNKNIEDDINNFDDSDDDSNDIPLVLPKLKFENHNEINLDKEELKKDELVIPSLKKETDYENSQVEVLDFDEVKSNIPLKVEVDNQEKNEEVINVLINKKNYIFLANNNKVEKNDHLKVIINNKIYFGVVTKPNYYRDINAMKIKPRKLVVVKNKSKQITSENVVKQNNVVDFDLIPIKKNKL